MIRHSIILQCYSVTSENIPSRGVKENQPTSMPFHLQVSYTKHTNFCYALYLCLILDTLVLMIQVLVHVGRFLSCFCCISLDLLACLSLICQVNKLHVNVVQAPNPHFHTHFQIYHIQ